MDRARSGTSTYRSEEFNRMVALAKSKGNLLADALRPVEQGKIKCGERHFEALGEDVDLKVANSFDTFIGQVT